MAGSDLSRRELLTRIAGGGIVLAGFALPEVLLSADPDSKPAQSQGSEEEITAAEDLMSEHGLLERLLLVYQDALDRIAAGKEFNQPAVVDSAKIIHEFIESYHEKLEEDHVFPLFEKAKLHVELVKTLRQQHQAGRELTKKILEGKQAQPGTGPLVSTLTAFIRMYRPHYAREDTVLFRSLPKVASEKEYDEMGDQFESIEQKLFGKDGFENMLKKVEAIEASVGIADLAKFTPA